MAACESTSPELPPDPPSAVAAVPASDRRIHLIWSLPSRSVTSVEVARSADGEPFAVIATLAGVSTSLQDAGLAPETTYRYRLRACNERACSAFGPEVAATTNAMLVFGPTTLPSAVVGETYRAMLSANGGDGTSTFALAGGRLPDNVTLTPAGELAGAPRPTGTFEFTVRVTSGDGQTTTAALRLTVWDLLTVGTGALPDATVGAPYQASLSAAGGDSTYTWSVDGGSLPVGLTMSEQGTVSGTPFSEEIALVTARVRSGDGQTATKELSITVTPASTTGFRVSTTLLPPGVVGLPYSPALTSSSDDESSATWSVVAGSLPPGVALEPNGGFSGLPAQAGTFTFTVRAQASERAFATLTIKIVQNDLSRFNITRVDVAPVSVAIEPHVSEAISRWESVVVADLSEDSIPRGFYPSGGCSGFGDDLNGAAIDDLIVLVNIGSIDGEGSTLGQAGPCGYRDDNYLTAVGLLTLDQADLELYVGTETLTDIVFHEIGHILGIGTLWDGFGCGQGTPGCFDYLEGEAGDNPTFLGPKAVQEWQALGGGGGVPVESTGGPGTALSHWRETTFDNEIMTGFVERPGVENPLSRVTIGSVADLGYGVSYAQADTYALPQTAPIGAATLAGSRRNWELPLPEPPLALPRR